jgi:hypothetical protein
MQRIFGEHISQLVEAYVNDIVVKSRQMRDLVPDLTTIFEKLKKFQVRLNLEKCVFGVPRWMLLGFVMSERGTSMEPVQNIKGVQRVTGCLAALSRFIARLGKQSLPLYQLVKKLEHFAWISKAQVALEPLKNLLEKLPILMMPAPGEPMLLYITATTQDVRTTLVVECDEPNKVLKVQRPVYFVNEVLSDSKTRYPQIQKLIYAMLISKRKPMHYFNVHPIVVVSKYPLKEVI